MKKFEDALSLCETQVNHVGKLQFIVFCLIVTLTVYFYRITFPFVPQDNDLVLVIYMLSPIFGAIILTFICTSFIASMWPSLELQTRNLHQQIPFQKRKKVWWFFSAIILPLLLAIIYDLIKK
jgi:hypothetical protein